jgi:hypothetical protein
VSWKVVPAITDAWYVQSVQGSKVSRIGQVSDDDPQRGQTNPTGQRRRAKYARQDSSAGNIA